MPILTCVFLWRVSLGGGPFSPIFLQIGDGLDAQVFLVVVLYDKKENIFKKFQNWIFTARTRGLKKRTPPLYGEKWKSC